MLSASEGSEHNYSAIDGGVLLPFLLESDVVRLISFLDDDAEDGCAKILADCRFVLARDVQIKSTPRFRDDSMLLLANAKTRRNFI